MSFKTEALVLHARTLQGADRVYDVLTPRDGKLSLVARGVAKSSSKMAGHLQPFTHVRMMIGRGRKDHLAGVATVCSYKKLRETWSDFILASSLVELIVRFNVPGQAAAKEFEMLRDTLSLLESDQLDARGKVLAGRIFLWKLMALSGWRPNLDQCALCREPMDAAAFYEPVKGFLCARHESIGIRLESGMLTFLSAVLDENDWLRIIEMAGANGLQRQWFEISQQYYQDIISHPLESTKLFNYAVS